MTLRSDALALYKPPFHFKRGYVFDSNGAMVADQGGIGEQHTVAGAIAARVRGWGRISYMPDAANLQDEVGQILAEALNAFWASNANSNDSKSEVGIPTSEPNQQVTADKSKPSHWWQPMNSEKGGTV